MMKVLSLPYWFQFVGQEVKNSDAKGGAKSQIEEFGDEVAWIYSIEDGAAESRNLSSAPTLRSSMASVAICTAYGHQLRGFDSVLYQDQGKGVRPLAFVSWSLLPFDRKTIGSGQVLLAVLGAHVCSKNETSQQRLRIIRQIPITKFNNQTMKDDIMLLQLETDAKINQYVNVLNLPKGGITDMKSGTRCTVAGWGKTKINNYSDTLQEVKVKVIDRGECKAMYGSIITQDMICVGDCEGRRNACHGDSGGPLICNKMYTGIVSFGEEGCPDPQIPAVYTLLTKKYIDWIWDIICYPLKNADGC
ncbi:granzyme A-like [Hypanus sabinus]|uniref:granzyme A-like n=1 Tax=Hypanus sabinus TaxID=79690 RepID=UPI0028C434AF|nr:granzyme A-like [Hypanus sabinus]